MGRPKECYFCARLVNAADGEHRKKINPSKHSSVKPNTWTFGQGYWTGSQQIRTYVAQNANAERFAVLSMVMDNTSPPGNNYSFVLMAFKSSGEMLWTYEFLKSEGDWLNEPSYLAMDDDGRVYMSWHKYPSPALTTLRAFDPDGEVISDQQFPAPNTSWAIREIEASGGGGSPIIYATGQFSPGAITTLEARSALNLSTLLWSKSVSTWYPLQYDEAAHLLTLTGSQVLNASTGAVVSPSNAGWIGSANGYMWRTHDPALPTTHGLRIYSTSDLVNPLTIVSPSIVDPGFSSIGHAVCKKTGRLMIGATNPGEKAWMVLNTDGTVRSRADYGYRTVSGINYNSPSSWYGWNGDGTGIVLGGANLEFPGTIPP